MKAKGGRATSVALRGVGLEESAAREWLFPADEQKSRGHFPIISRDPYIQKTIRTPGKQLVLEKSAA